MKRRGNPAGFTLIELLVVISIIALVLAMVLPSLVGVFSAGAKEQSKNMLSAMLQAARGLAVEQQTYTLVHCQLGLNPDGSTGDKCYVTIFQRDPDNLFRPARGFSPQEAPGNMSFGQITEGKVVKWGEYVYGHDYIVGMTQDQLLDFTTLNFVFGPDGMPAVGYAANLDTSVGLFAVGSPDRLYAANNPSVAVNEPGDKYCTMVHWPTFKNMTGDGRYDYLNTGGTIIGLNVHSGQLLATK